MELASLAAGGMAMDPSMMGAGMMGECVTMSHVTRSSHVTSGTPMPNQCCAHGAMHCTVPGAGGLVPDPSTGMLPPIDPGMAALGVGGLYDARTPHGGIKQKVIDMK